MKQVQHLSAANLRHVFLPPNRLENLAWLVALVFCTLLNSASAQLTIKVTSVPLGTPANANIYLAGNFNNWNPADPARKLTSLGNGKYTITMNPAPGQVEFKFTQGSWNLVEGNLLGAFQPNHKVAYNGQPKTVELVILTWTDGSNGNTQPIATGVQVLDDNFYVPELARTRRIWMYLPADYNLNPGKHYPVIYMQDGQNLFDAATSFAGEWGVDESLDLLAQNGDQGCIIVGIDNGGVHYLDEYSPWVNPAYGGGEGIDYVHFICNTLKPYIDANYRTLSDRDHTGIFGSSMGGLISMYALIEHQDVFSKAGIFSPAFWFVGEKEMQHIETIGKQADVRVYFLAGGQEPAYIGQDVEAAAEAMFANGFGQNEVRVCTPADGEHAEWFWGREFGAAYQWLFAGYGAQGGSVTSTNNPDNNTGASLKVYPNPATDWVQVTGDDLSGNAAMRIVGADGRIWYDQPKANVTEPIWTGDLPRGMYTLVMRTKGRTQTLKFVHE